MTRDKLIKKIATWIKMCIRDRTKKVISGSKEGYDAELALLKEKHAETDDRIKRLVESLSVASETSAKYVMEQIDELHRESETQQMRLAEREALTEQSRMLHQEFAFHQDVYKRQGLGKPALITLNYPADAKLITKEGEDAQA